MFHLTRSLAHVFLVVMATCQLASCEKENKAGGGGRNPILNIPNINLTFLR